MKSGVKPPHSKLRVDRFSPEIHNQTSHAERNQSSRSFASNAHRRRSEIRSLAPAVEANRIHRPTQSERKSAGVHRRRAQTTRSFGSCLVNWTAGARQDHA